MSSAKSRTQDICSTEGSPLVGVQSVWKLRFRQTLAASGPIVTTLSSGMTSGFSAVLLPQLALDTSEIKVGPDENSWIASVAVLTMALGCIISGYLMESKGRRFTQLSSCVLSAIGWIILSLASNLWTIYVSRLITGLCVGLLGPTSIVYIAETTDPRFRGTILAGIPLAVSTGILCSHIFGTLFDWKIAAALCSTFPIIGYILLLPAPESPVWLVNKGKLTDAEEAFRWLRGHSQSATEEMKNVLKKKDSVSALSKSKFDMETLKLILDPSFLKPFVIMNVFFFIQQFSGANAVTFYSINILRNVSSDINEYLSTFIIDIVRVVMSGFACFLLKKFSRRMLALLSSTGTALSLFVLAYSTKYLSAQYSLVSLIAIVVYTSVLCFGIFPLPWIMIGEVFPHSLRELGSGSTSCFGFLIFFSVVKITPYLISSWGIEGAFTIFGIIASIGTLFLYFCLPETKNKTLQEIEDGFKKDKNTERSNRII